MADSQRISTETTQELFISLCNCPGPSIWYEHHGLWSWCPTLHWTEGKFQRQEGRRTSQALIRGVRDSEFRCLPSGVFICSTSHYQPPTLTICFLCISFQETCKGGRKKKKRSCLIGWTSQKAYDWGENLGNMLSCQTRGAPASVYSRNMENSLSQIHIHMETKI